MLEVVAVELTSPQGVVERVTSSVPEANNAPCVNSISALPEAPAICTSTVAIEGTSAEWLMQGRVSWVLIAFGSFWYKLGRTSPILYISF
jgi:hypothetical protein